VLVLATRWRLIVPRKSNAAPPRIHCFLAVLQARSTAVNAAPAASEDDRGTLSEVPKPALICL